ncbi:MAG: sigma-70 family RNA polymerase sigma factor [Gemmatimonadaceae bacterium]
MPPEPSDDAELIARARAGSTDALGALYARYAEPVMALAYRLLGSVADAEDVLHDVFLGLPEALRRYDERGSFPSWLKRIAARAALTRARSEGRRREVPLDAELHHAGSAEADAFAARSAVERALAGLPVTLRAVVVLKELEGYSHAEIGALLGISNAASEVRLCRALRLLRRAMEGSR